MTPYPLSKSERNTKILITLFLVTIIIAFGVAELNVYDKVGRIKDGIAERYGPDEPQPIQAAPDQSSEVLPLEPGISNDEPLPMEGDMPVARMNTFTALLDVTHPHAFEIPIVMLVLAHFLMRTRVAGWFKLTNYIAGFLGIIAFIATPWMVRYLSIKTAPLLYLGAAAMGLTALIMVVVSIWDMWTPIKKESSVYVKRQTQMVEPAGQYK